MKKTTLILILLLFGSVFNNVWSQGQIYVSGTNTQTTITSNSPTAIAPGLTISSTENITDFTVSVTDSYSTNDAVGYTGSLPSGITTSGWNATKRAIVFKGTKTAEEWQAFLRNLTITTANVCSPETRKVSFIAGETFYNPLNGHFYKITTSPSNWLPAKAAAASDSYYGSQGYLVTLTSAAENTFVSRLIGQNAWMGASDDYLQINEALGYTLYPNQGASEGKWYWVTGPEKGRQMSTANQVNISSVYQNWGGGEPNNAGGEHCLHIYSANGFWNDFANTQNIYGIVEYGDMPGDLSNSSQQFTQEIYIQGSSSGTISGGNATVCAGSNSTTLTLSGFTGSVVRWESSVDNFITAGTNISNTSTTLTVNNISTTTYYRAVVNSTSPSTCNGLVTSSAPVYVNSAVSGNVFAMNTNICDGSDVDLYLSGQEGEVQKWQRSTDNSTWTDIANTNPTLIETVNTVGTLYYRAFVQVPGCGAAVITPSKSITVVTGTPPQGGTVSSNTHFSATNSGTLTLSGYTGTISKWQRSTDDGLVWIDITNTTSSYNYSNINKETLFRALVANGSCGASYSTSGKVEIIFTPTISDFAPITAAQGNEVVITGTNLENVTQVQFEGVDAASFTINSTSKITAIVPSGTTSGDISVTNSGGSDSMSGFILNVAPTDIELSSSSIAENNDLNDVVGQFSGTDPDISDTFTFGLVPGTGDTDNESFSISGNNLLANLVFDFETKFEYTVRVEVQDNYGNSYEKTFTINVTDVNESPTDITLDNAVVVENIAMGSIVGVLGAIDEDSANTFTYTLATGDGTNDADNASFSIEGTDLKLAVIPDYETQSTYAIYINVNDGANDFQKTFAITVTDVNEDLDADGVPNSIDQCPDTPTGESVDANGCSASQKDSDGDGVNDADDAFPNDANEDTDSDGDGTGDNADAFPNDANEDTDTDGDGVGDNADAFPNDANEDTDSDGDGTGDNADAFPNDVNEDTDTDGDGIGDNEDTDDDNDGTLDVDDAFPLDASEDMDTDGDGIGDNEDTDDDNDGTLDVNDVFPLDASEDTDTDGDGIGNNEDTDDDNDGLLDVDDSEPLTSLTDLDGDGIVDSADNCPSVANANQSDTDGDGEGNVCDADDDNDGVPDTQDAFPLDATEDTDTDGDGTGDNADTDDDNDGILDLDDAFPFDSTESVDTDGDGIGNNADTDDDGDGVLDAVDQFPLDASEQSDADNDGIGDNKDGDDDNDGIVDGNDDFPTDNEPMLVPAQAFTPNGDGNNDSWMVPGIDNYPNNRVSVYNRWGHLVFEANGYANDWEGFYKKNSEKLPQGSYLYVIDLGEGGAPLRGWIFINY
ncbi:MAG: gliding motility-associated C-terminal domain-containing protein [Maribacter sp.]